MYLCVNIPGATTHHKKYKSWWHFTYSVPGKTSKNVLVLSSLQPTVIIGTNQKKTQETVAYCDKTKYRVDILGKMERQCSIKASPRRWPVHMFYNFVGMATINATVIYKNIKKSKLSRRNFNTKLAHKLQEGI